MNSNKKTGRIAGALLLFSFISGITIFQFLQSAVLTSKDFVIAASENENHLILSTILSVFSGIASVIVAVILLTIFKKHHFNLAVLFVAFCIFNFVAIMIDNYSVLSMLEFSKASVNNINEASNSLKMMETVIYQKHIWTHYFYLLISCFPVFVLYTTLFVSKLVPRVLSGFGVFAVILMFIQILGTIFGQSMSLNMLLPIGLIQLIFPFWLMIKGLKSSKLEFATD
ncbi:MAG: hypothetical protein ACJA1D_000879 [Polaribacter sp.]|jgi:hypothetical protein